MELSKRERVIRAIERDREPDKIPIHYFGFEKTNISYQTFINSEYYKKNELSIKNNFSRWRYKHAGNITEQIFLNVDCYNTDPFDRKIKIKPKENLKTLNPPEHPNCELDPITGRIFKDVIIPETGRSYRWYVAGYFTSPEILYSYWDDYGKPSENINEKLNYSPKVWNDFVEKLSDYFYPMAVLPISPFESLFEGMNLNRVSYYIRKNPSYIHAVLNEYTKVNLEIIKRLNEAGVEAVWFGDDLGYKGRSILSLKQFIEFILPCYKKMYDACKKYGMYITQHSCGYIDELLPYMADAGLSCIQSLEPSAGVDLANLKETLGDKITFIGGIDSSPILNFGTPKDVEAEVKRCIRAAASGGGYIAGPSHDILNAPWENILALRKAIEKYRTYPLKN